MAVAVRGFEIPTKGCGLDVCVKPERATFMYE